MQRQYPHKWAMDVVKAFIESCPRGVQIIENLISYLPEMAAYHLQFKHSDKWEAYKWICKQAEREKTLCDKKGVCFNWTCGHVVKLLNKRWASGEESSINGSYLPKIAQNYLDMS